jgi:hypothetical protein
MPTNLPIKIDEDIAYFTQVSNHLKEQIMDIEKVDNLPKHNHVFVHFRNGYVASILQGWATFNHLEIAVKKDGKLLAYFEDNEQIHRTADPNEIIKIMYDVSNL